MVYFRLWRVGYPHGESYWVDATTPEYARRLVALNVRDAADAEKVGIFNCEPTDDAKPSPNFIYRRLAGPMRILKR